MLGWIYYVQPENLWKDLELISISEAIENILVLGTAVSLGSLVMLIPCRYGMEIQPPNTNDGDGILEWGRLVAGFDSQGQGGCNYFMGIKIRVAECRGLYGSMVIRGEK